MTDADPSQEQGACSMAIPRGHTRASSGPPPTITIDTVRDDSACSGEENTTSQVTLEARRVLEQFLKRSLSHNDASPYQREQLATELELIREEQLGDCGGVSGSVLRSESYYNAAIENPYYMYSPHSHTDQVEPDYVYAHSIISKTNSVSSQSSYGYSLKSYQGRSHSPSDKMTLSVHPPTTQVKVKSKKKAHFDTSSSSSTEDYEYVDNEYLSRKKKSFFRWASERLRESFRRKKEASATSNLESPDEDQLPGCSKKPKKKKKGKLLLHLKRNGSEKSKSSSTPNDAGAEGDSKTTSKKDEKDKGLWDSFIKSFRKSGLKLKRKGSKGKWTELKLESLHFVVSMCDEVIWINVTPPQSARGQGQLTT